EMPLERDLEKMQIFVDRSSVEIFANDGEATFTTHLYPTGEEFGHTASGSISLKIRRVQPSVADTFVV
ncbi:MAG: GH32 C-terminal domain-containing protein, partial [Lachnospiraceae bacterium]|nr:GH32 C-terminal domain-containing protein [Lachnospiraceae bacterium]